jgi:hypothetical protein
MEQDQVRDEQPYCVGTRGTREADEGMRSALPPVVVVRSRLRGRGHRRSRRKRTACPYGKVCALKREALIHRRTGRRESKLQGGILAGCDRYSWWRSDEWARRGRLNRGASHADSEYGLRWSSRIEFR